MKRRITLLINAIKLAIFNKLILELCDGSGCHNCKAWSYDSTTLVSNCALTRTIDVALDKWGSMEET